MLPRATFDTRADMGHIWDRQRFGGDSQTSCGHLAGIMQRPWQGSNLRHTVEESCLARPARVGDSVKARG